KVSANYRPSQPTQASQEPKPAPIQDSKPSTAAQQTPSPSQIPASAAQILNTAVQPLLARLQANPKDVAAMIELGNINYDAGQWNDAIGYYTRALNLTPSNLDVRTDMGVAYFNSGNADQALTEFNRVLKDDPKHVQTLFNIGGVKLTGKNH